MSRRTSALIMCWVAAGISIGVARADDPPSCTVTVAEGQTLALELELAGAAQRQGGDHRGLQRDRYSQRLAVLAERRAAARSAMRSARSRSRVRPTATPPMPPSASSPRRSEPRTLPTVSNATL